MEFCEAHWERVRQMVPVFKMDLCKDCFAGRPIKSEEMEVTGGPDESETRARRNAALKAGWANPEKRARRLAAMNRPETRARISAAMKAAWSNPETRARISAAQKARRLREKAIAA